MVVLAGGPYLPAVGKCGAVAIYSAGGPGIKYRACPTLGHVGKCGMSRHTLHACHAASIASIIHVPTGRENTWVNRCLRFRNGVSSQRYEPAAIAIVTAIATPARSENRRGLAVALWTAWFEINRASTWKT